MDNIKLTFDHIHLISEDPKTAAKWYEEVLGATIAADYELRGAPQINVTLGGMTIIIRGRRSGEEPGSKPGMQHYADYSSHNQWGTDHFGFSYQGDLLAFCEEITAKGATFAVEPWEFTPGNMLCYVAAPDGVSIEIIQG